MKHSTYTSYDDLPLMLSGSEVAAVLGISRAGAYELDEAAASPRSKSAAGSSCRRTGSSHGSTQTSVPKHTVVVKEYGIG